MRKIPMRRCVATQEQLPQKGACKRTDPRGSYPAGRGTDRCNRQSEWTRCLFEAQQRGDRACEKEKGAGKSAVL